MMAIRRALGAFLLVCVSLALGDAPYIDEFLEALGAPVQALAGDVSHHPDAPPVQNATIKFCQNLLILSTAPHGTSLGSLARVAGFRRTAPVSYSSAGARRIDRPPATLRA